MEERKLSLSEYAAREIRAHLGRDRISVSALARKLDWSQSYLARRVDGRVAFDLDDLEKVAAAIGISVTDLLPSRDVANTLWNHASAESTSSAPVSPDRPPRNAKRHRTRPGRTTPKASSVRPAMIPRPAFG